MKISVDRKRCIGLGYCVAAESNVFKLDDYGKAILLHPESVSAEKPLETARARPVDAITLYKDNGKFVNSWLKRASFRV